MLVIIVACAFAQIVYAQTQNLEVNTTQGVVVGASATDGNYFTFYGVHYGGDTSGQNRFKSPPPPPTYPGPFIAHDQNVICAQPSPRGLIGTEDCLTLNIFTNGTTPNKPVLVWLVSDEYTSSDSNIPSPSFRRIVLEGVVVVQVNYRLSIFGFLCLGVADAPGNAGLKDVVQALKWIKANIAGFGGDPNNVILFGHGSGAAMVDLITLSPSATGLLHKAIAQSGSALAPWAIAYDPVGYAQALGNKVGYHGTTNARLASLLVTTDLSVLQAALNDFEFYNNTILFAPCIEDPNLNVNDTFLAEAPINILQRGNYSDVPYVTGYTDREGTARAEEAAVKGWLNKMQTNFTWFLPADLNFKDNLTNVERAIREFYFSQRNINMETIEDFLDYQGDTLTLVSVIRGARIRASTSRSEVRLLEFAFKGTQNTDWPFQTIPVTGAKHGSVLNFLLGYDLREVDEPVMTSLLRRFVSFFYTGVPNSATTPGVIWQPVTNSSLQYLLYGGAEIEPRIIQHNEEARVNPHTQRMTLWNDIYFKYYVPPKSVSSAPRLLGVAMFVLLCQVIVRLF